MPQLATSWQWTADSKALDPQAAARTSKFHDGEPIDAAAVKFNIERMLTMPDIRRKGEIGAVTAVEVIDDHGAAQTVGAVRAAAGAV